MIPLLPFLEPLAKLATAAIEHTVTRKQRLSLKDSRDLSGRIAELEAAEFEFDGLMSDLSAGMEKLGQAMQEQLEENRQRISRLNRFVFLALVASFASLTLSILNFLR